MTLSRSSSFIFALSLLMGFTRLGAMELPDLIEEDVGFLSLLNSPVQKLTTADSRADSRVRENSHTHL